MPADETLSSAVAAHVKDSSSRQGLMKHLGAQITVLKNGFCRICVLYRSELTQQHGYFHAGVTSALVDTAGGYAALSTFDAVDSVLTVDFTVNLLAPARGTRLLAEAHVVRSGRTLTVCRLEAYTESAHGQGTHIATGSQTLIRLAETSDSSG